MRKSAAVTVAAVALATDMFVYGIAVPVLPRISAADGMPPAAMGLLFAVYAGAALLVTPLAGRWVDRVGPRTPMLAGLVALAAATLLFAFVHPFAVLLVARALQGAAAAVSWTAGLGLIAAAYPPAERGKPMGLALSASSLGILLGPLVGGFLADLFFTGAPFVLAAIVAVADGIARVVLIRDVPHTRVDRPASVWRHPVMPVLFGLVAFGAGLIAFLEPILPSYASTIMGASSGQIGLLFGLAALASVFANPLAGFLADKASRAAVTFVGAVVSAGGLVVVATAGNLWLTGLGLCLVTTGSAFILTPTITMIGSVADSHQPPAYGAAYGVYMIAYTAGMMIAPLAAGAGGSGLGFPGAALAGGAAVFALGVIAALRLRTLPTPAHSPSS